MIPEYKTKTNIFAGLGLVLQLGSRMMVVGNQDPNQAALWTLVLLVGWVLIIVGCVYYAKGKGYSGAWGLLGLLNVIGFIILVLFKDRHKEAQA